MDYKNKKRNGTEKGRDKGIRLYRSPFRLLLIIAGSIFATEALVMLLIAYLQEESPFLHAILDSTLLLILLLPVLYFFLLRPLVRLVDERRNAEIELTKERDTAHKYLDIAGVIILVLDTEGSVRLINKRGSEILGFNENEIIGKDWIKNFIPHRLRNEIEIEFKTIIEGKSQLPGYYENPILAKGGEERTILWSNRLLIENGKITGVLSSGEDITERKRAERALKESETRYRLVHNTAFDAILISNALDRVIDCNPSAEKTFGYGEGELIGIELIKLMPEQFRQRHLRGLKRFLETGVSTTQGRVLELEGLRKNGEVFPIELVLNSFTLGGVLHFTGMIRDITERRRAEREKEEIQNRLNQAQKMEAIGRFAGGIAHDFNNILTSIRGNAELALEDLDKSDPLYPRLNDIVLSVLHASKLTQQLLLFSRGQAAEKVPLNINAIIENLLVIITRLIGANITISADLAPDIWTIFADEGSTEQVLMNLALNARDAMPNGGILTMKTENMVFDIEQCKGIPEAHPGEVVCLSISDTGVGMKKELIGRIFEPFFTTKEAGKGTGFGLTVVYGIIKQHEGWIKVESEPGKGTTFSIYIPAFLKGVKPSGAEATIGENARILIAESNPSQRESARNALTKQGFLVFDAATAQEAIEIANREHGAIDLLLSNIILPDESGIRLAEDILLIKQDIPVIITGTAKEWERFSKLLNESGFKFLQSPYSTSGLIRAVSNSIEELRLKR